MENNWKRFLSLALALVMVISLMPMGHLHAHAESNLVIGDKITEMVAGDYVICTEGIGGGSSRIDSAYLTSTPSGSKLALSLSDTPVWTVTVANETNGTYYVTDSNGQYLKVEANAASVTSDATELKLYYGDAADGHSSGFYIADSSNGQKLNYQGGTATAEGRSGTGSWAIWQFRPFHTPDAAVVENRVESTCTKAGSYDSVVYCSDCGVELSRETIPLELAAHTEVTIPGQPATCTATGLTDGVKCSVCDALITAQEVIPVTSHTPAAAVEENRTESTCTTKGSYDSVIYCSVCNTELSRDTVTLELAAHTPNEDDGNCTTEVTCSVCGAVTTPAAADHNWDEGEITTEPGCESEGERTYTCTVCGRIRTEVVPAISHNYQKVVTAPTCTEKGYTTYTCANCGHSYDGDYVGFTGHTWGEWTEVTPSTCTKAGLEMRVCLNDETHVEYNDLALAAHTPAEAVKENEVAPTLNSAGSYDSVVYCSVCGKELSRDTVNVPALEGAVAEVNGVKYATLAEAVEKAADGDTVTLLKDTVGAGVVIDKDITINLGGFIYTFNQTVGSTGTTTLGFQILKDNDVTIKNGTLTSTDTVEGSKEVKVLIQNYANLTLTDVNLVDNTAHILYALSNNSGEVKLNGSTSITTDAVAFDVCKYASYAEPTVTVNTTGTIEGEIEVTGGTLNLTAANINGTLDYQSGSVTKAETVDLDAPADYKWVDGVLTAKVYVAEVNGVKYESLAEAVDAAGDNATVTLLKDTTGAGVVINKNITIDLGGFTYTFNQTVGSTGTTTLGFQILKDNDVTIKNGTLTSTDTVEGSKEVKVLIQNYANLTLTDVNLVDNTAHILYALSNNSGEVKLNGSTSIDTDAVAFDVCKYASYAEPTVTVDTTGTITGEIEVTGGTLTLTAADIDGTLDYQSGSVTKAETVTLAAPEGYKWDDNGVLTEIKYVASVTMNDVTTYFESLPEAVAYASTTTTSAPVRIDLLMDAAGPGAVFKDNACVELHLNDHTYTFTEGVGSTGTESNGFQILASAGQVNIYNGTLEIAEESASKFYTVIQNYTNLSLTNVTVDATYADKWAKDTDPANGDSYAVSNNGGMMIMFLSGTKIIANDDGDKAYAFDVYDHPSYEGEPTVTVWESTIVGKVDAIATNNGTYFATFQNALDHTKNYSQDKTITLLKEVTVTADTTYDLSGVTVESAGDAFVVTAGTLTLNGDGVVKAGLSGIGSWTAVWANGGKVVINGGTYSVAGDDNTTGNHQNDLIYTKNGGTVEIYGGTFLNDGNIWTLNKKDAGTAAAGGDITVYGGSFQNWNPANNASEGANTNFVAEGYCADEVDGYYVVAEHEYDAVVTAPTCTEKGYTTYTCSRCGDSYVADEVAALGHTEEIIPGKAATCTETGLTEGKKCSVCGEILVAQEEIPMADHTPGEPVEEDGYMVTHCSVCGEELSREEIVVETAKVTMRSMNVLLEDEIKLTYTIAIPEELVNAGVTVVLTKVGGFETVVKEYNGNELISRKNNDGYYVVEMGIASGEMTCPISVSVLDADGNELSLYNNSGVVIGTSAAYSVVNYASIILNGNYKPELKALARALVVYGGYAQTKFGTFDDELAYEKLKIEPDLSGVTADTVEQYKSGQTNSNMGVVANGINTYLDSNIFMRVYMKVEGDIAGYTFTLTTPAGDQPVNPVYDSATNRYYVDITGIASAYIDFEYKITVTNGTDTNVITTSVLSYVRTVLNGNYDEKMQNLVKAMYLYNQAANANWPGR